MEPVATVMAYHQQLSPTVKYIYIPSNEKYVYHLMNPPAVQETPIRLLGREDLLKKG